MTTTLARARRVPSTFLVAGTIALAACGGDDDDAGRNGGAASTATAGADTTGGAATTEAVATTDAVETTGAVETSAPDEGVVFEPPDGDYTVVFPAEPVENTQDLELPDGSTLPITFYLHETAERAEGTAAITYGPDVEASLEGARDGAIASLPGATLVGSEPITQQGRDGLEFVAELGTEGAQGFYISRVFLDGQTLYQVIVVGPDDEATDPDVAAFLDSFRFTEDR